MSKNTGQVRKPIGRLTRAQLQQELLLRGWRWEQADGRWRHGDRVFFFVNACIECGLDPTWAMETGK